MSRTINRFMGFHNPPLVGARGYALAVMPKKKIMSHAAQMLREAVSANFNAAVQRCYPASPVTTAYLKIKRATGCSLSTLQRIEKGQTSPQTDTLADIAWHLGTTVKQLVDQSAHPPARPDGHSDPTTPSSPQPIRARRIRRMTA